MSKKLLFNFERKLTIYFFTIIALPILILALYFYDTNIKYLKQNQLDLFQNQSLLAIEDIDKNLESIYQFTNHISFNPIINQFFMKGFYDDTEIIYKINNEINPLIDWIELLKPTSVNSFLFFTQNAAIPETSTIKYIDAPHLKLINSKDFYSYHFHSSNSSLSYMYPLGPYLQGTTTYLEIQIDPLILLEPLINLGKLTEVSIDVYTSNKELLYTSEQRKPSEKFPEDFSKGFWNIKTDSKGSKYYRSDLGIHNDTLYVSISLPYKTIDKYLNESYLSFFIILITSLALFALFVYMGTHFSFLRLQRIISAIRQLQHGNFKISIPHGNKDEIDELAESINIMSYEIDTLINKVYISELEQKKLVLTALQKQINPHFIYNTLECIRMKAELNDQDEIADNITALGCIMRYNIAMTKDYETLSDELKNLQSYVAIQNILNNNKIKFTLCLNDIDTYLHIPKFCIQPIIENSICHGMSYLTEFLNLTLTIYAIEDTIIIDISDDGQGVDAQTLDKINSNFTHFSDTIPLDKNQGVALYNINTRLKLSYGDQYGLTAFSELGKGFRIRLTIPANL